MIPIVAHRRWWYAISGGCIGASVIAIVSLGFNLGIDFTGGSLIAFEFHGAPPATSVVRDRVQALGVSSLQIQQEASNRMLLRTAPLSEETHRAVVDAFREDASEVRYESIGPSIGRELARKTATGVALALVLIVCYVAWGFRKAGREVSSWAYGVVTLIAMAHDAVIPMGVFAVLGKWQHVEIDAPFIAALLTVLGYSISDTIVVLDRIRENLRVLAGKPFDVVVEASVQQTMGRSIRTTLTTLLALLAVIAIGGASIRPFATALFIGIGVGAYSSVFIASPLLVTWHQRKRR